MERKPRYKIEVIDSIPDKVPEGAHESTTQMVLRELRDASTGLIQITSEFGPADLDRLYKTMIQWRARHKNSGLGIKKQGQTVYFWRIGRKEGVSSKPDLAQEQRPYATGSTALF